MASEGGNGVQAFDNFNNGSDMTWDDAGAVNSGGNRGRSRSPQKRSRSRSPGDRGHRRRKRSRERTDDEEVKEVRTRRAFICNLPYDVSWQDLKDLCKQEVGDAYVEVYDEKGKSTGCAAAEFRDIETCKKAIEVLHRKELKGRLIVVREETPADRRRFDRNERGRRDDRNERLPTRMERGPLMDADSNQPLNSYGINPQILQQLGIEGQLVNTVFVANLDYKVDDKKLQEIFKMSGKIVKAEIKRDKDGKSRGFGSVEFDHPVQAVQAVSMFNGQTLFERAMAVKMDKEARPKKQELPSGLRSVGKGLGLGGTPIHDVNEIASTGFSGLNAGMNMGLDSMTGFGSSMGGMGSMGNAGMAGLSGMGNMPNMGSNSSAMMSGFTGGMNSLGSGMGGSDMGMMTMGGMNSSSMGGGLGSGMMSGSGLNSGMGLASGFGSGFGSGLGSGMGNLGSGMGSGTGGLGDGLLGSGGGLGMNMNMNSSSLMGNMGGGGSSNYGNRGGGNRENSTIIISQLPLTFTWQNLRERFRDCGDVKYAEIKTENGKSRGIGIIRFGRPEEAKRAINLMDGSRIDGRMIEVRMDR